MQMPINKNVEIWYDKEINEMQVILPLGKAGSSQIGIVICTIDEEKAKEILERIKFVHPEKLELTDEAKVTIEFLKRVAEGFKERKYRVERLEKYSSKT